MPHQPAPAPVTPLVPVRRRGERACPYAAAGSRDPRSLLRARAGLAAGQAPKTRPAAAGGKSLGPLPRVAGPVVLVSEGMDEMSVGAVDVTYRGVFQKNLAGVITKELVKAARRDDKV